MALKRRKDQHIERRFLLLFSTTEKGMKKKWRIRGEGKQEGEKKEEKKEKKKEKKREKVLKKS